MTTDMTTHDTTDGHDADAKLALQQRQQLSALVDGDLAPDQARFLLRRLGHDESLAGRWHRWHLIGDVLRGQPVASLPAGGDGFAAGVAAAVAREGNAPGAARRPRWQHGIGLAAAASVAAVALFLARPVSVESERPGAVAAVDAPAATALPEAVPASPEPVREVSVPQFAVATPAPGPAPVRTVPVEPPPVREPATVVALPEAPSVAATVPAEATGMPPAIIAAATRERPFASPAEPQPRPWPRAVLPDLAGTADGRFTVGFGDTVEAPSFYPFEPQLPERAVDPERTP